MSEKSGNDDKSRAISEVPEYILRAIVRMGEPSVQAIERILPAQHKKLAPEIHERLVGDKRREAGDAPAAAAAPTQPDDSGQATPSSGWMQDKPPAWSTPSESRPSGANPAWESAPPQVPPTDGAPASAAPSGPGPVHPGPESTPAAPAAPGAPGASAASRAPAAPAADARPAPTAEERQEPAEPEVTVNPLVAGFKRYLEGGAGVESVMNPGDRLNLDNTVFDQYEFGESSKVGAEGIKVRHRGRGDAAKIEVTWKRPSWVNDGDIVVYRVIASDRIVSPSPEAGDLVLCTVGHGYEEPVPSRIAFRHYQVWVNVGEDHGSALRSQPRLVGEDICVLPVPGVDITVSAGVVEGKWDFLHGYSEIRVFASPADSPEPVDSPANQLFEGVTKKGFEHKSPIRGDRMRFAITPAVEFRGTKEVCTRPDVHEIFITAELEKVSLEMARGVNVGGDERIHITFFSPAAGQVKIYLSPSAPSPGLSFQAVPVEALERDQALAEGRVVADEQNPEGEQIDVQPMWPAEWDEVHITPVTIVDDMAVVGDTEVLQRVRPIEHAKLVERTDSQLVTFEWPAGASMVKIETAPTGSTAPEDRTAHTEYDEKRYRRDGGVRLHLNSYGENVLLTPRSMYAGRETSATPTVLAYRGLRQYRYSLSNEHGGIVLRLWCEGGDDRNPPTFTLVHHPVRFPLSLEDAMEQGAGECRVAQILPGQTTTFGEPSRLIRPDRLPDQNDRTESATWFLPPEEIMRMRPGQWFRLFIVDSGMPGGGHDPDGPRRIVTDVGNPMPFVHPSMWGAR